MIKAKVKTFNVYIQHNNTFNTKLAEHTVSAKVFTHDYRL